MKEDEAQDWLATQCHVSLETLAKLAHFHALLTTASAAQNLVSASTLDHIWARHIVDSAQLLLFAERKSGDTWLDLGTGAGFPGLVIAILDQQPIHLVEERRGRISFLNDMVSTLGLSHCTVHGCKIQALDLPPVSVISARAFAPLPKLFSLAHSFSTAKTRWLLPKGKSAQAELESLHGSWHGVFHVKQSVTDADAAILVGTDVKRAKAT